MSLAWAIDACARKQLEDEVFGKRVLITDREDRPIAEVVAGDRWPHAPLDRPQHPLNRS